MDIAILVVSTLTLLVAGGGVWATVVVHWRSVERDDRLRAEAESEARIADVVADYARQIKIQYHGPTLGTAQEAGIRALHSDGEVRDALVRMIPKGDGDPMQGELETFANVDLLAVFRFARENRIDLNSGPAALRSAIKRMRDAEAESRG